MPEHFPDFEARGKVRPCVRTTAGRENLGSARRMAGGKTSCCALGSRPVKDTRGTRKPPVSFLVGNIPINLLRQFPILALARKSGSPECFYRARPGLRYDMNLLRREEKPSLRAGNCRRKNFLLRVRVAAGKRYERGLTGEAGHGVPGVLLPSQTRRIRQNPVSVQK